MWCSLMKYLIAAANQLKQPIRVIYPWWSKGTLGRCIYIVVTYVRLRSSRYLQGGGSSVGKLLAVTIKPRKISALSKETKQYRIGFTACNKHRPSLDTTTRKYLIFLCSHRQQKLSKAMLAATLPWCEYFPFCLAVKAPLFGTWRGAMLFSLRVFGWCFNVSSHNLAASVSTLLNEMLRVACHVTYKWFDITSR